jgi:hypothetical protein
MVIQVDRPSVLEAIAARERIRVAAGDHSMRDVLAADWLPGRIVGRVAK